MNKRIFIARLTDAELADEVSMYAAEMVNYLHDLSQWSGYDMYQRLQDEQRARAQVATRRVAA